MCHDLSSPPLTPTEQELRQTAGVSRVVNAGQSVYRLTIGTKVGRDAGPQARGEG